MAHLIWWEEEGKAFALNLDRITSADFRGALDGTGFELRVKREGRDSAAITVFYGAMAEKVWGLIKKSATHVSAEGERDER